MWRSSVSRLLVGSFRPTVQCRAFHLSAPAANGSIFGDLTKAPTKPEASAATAAEPLANPKEILPQDDAELQQYHLQEALKEQILSEKYVTPLKRQLFELNVAANGFFKNHQIVDNEGKQYKLSLTEQEIEALEPSLYLQSARIKSSVKKATLVNRFVRGYKVKNAINQLHFNPKKMATELERLLKQGMEHARARGYNEDELYIHAVWAGSDGGTVKRPDIKGRGRMGILHHRHIHVKAVLKTEQTLLRLKWEKEQRELQSKPKMYLNNEPLNFRVRSFYRW